MLTSRAAAPIAASTAAPTTIPNRSRRRRIMGSSRQVADVDVAADARQLAAAAHLDGVDDRAVTAAAGLLDDRAVVRLDLDRLVEVARGELERVPEPAR